MRIVSHPRRLSPGQDTVIPGKLQREACGLNNLAHVMQVCGVHARMGPLAMPGIHPTKTIAG
jgi:hypothetical protein